MKNLANLKDVKTLNKTQQKSINGGLKHCLLPDNTCSRFWIGCAEPQCQSL